MRWALWCHPDTSYASPCPFVDILSADTQMNLHRDRPSCRQAQTAYISYLNTIPKSRLWLKRLMNFHTNVFPPRRIDLYRTASYRTIRILPMNSDTNIPYQHVPYTPLLSWAWRDSYSRLSFHPSMTSSFAYPNSFVPPSYSFPSCTHSCFRMWIAPADTRFLYIFHIPSDLTARSSRDRRRHSARTSFRTTRPLPHHSSPDHREDSFLSRMTYTIRSLRHCRYSRNFCTISFPH